MTRWTEEQGRAIALSERRLLISAAAGSGKTAVLTERSVSRVLDETRPVDIDRLLIMTFTRAAAAEMRERIRRRMEDSLEAAVREGKTGLAARAKRELAALDAAQITTIDSFCLSVLRDHADRLEVDPAFRVGGDEELRILKSDVLQIEDLKPGMILRGTVRNVIDFGAFVDIGVHQDGLVHISRMKKGKFVKHPSEVVKVGDIVEVKVVEADVKKQRIGLSMIL